MTAVQARDVQGPLVIGAGLAGLFAALKMAPRPVLVLSPAPMGEGASSAWAQGGVAAALSPTDTPEAHAADTVAAGAGLVDAAAAAAATGDAAARVEDLSNLGAPFARDAQGAFLLSKEAAHSCARVARFSAGDGAGRAIMEALIAAVRRTPSIEILEGVSVERILTLDGAARGAVARARDGSPLIFTAGSILLAAGGVGGLYAATTNPPSIKGLGLGLAALAGAVTADVEFVQFHPTAIDVGRDPTPLATEAIRGEGATLVNSDGRRFMPAVHPAAELAPRDVVARAVFREKRSGRGAFLDARAALGAAIDVEFPTVAAAVRAAGLDPSAELIPVAPSAHYHMGGAETDLRGRSSVEGLWICGEAASTGLHGANRLASNGLLESLVFAARAAEDILAQQAPTRALVDPGAVSVAARPAAPPAETATHSLRQTMSDLCGVERDGAGLTEALARLERLSDASQRPAWRAMIASATLIAAAARRRKESRGGHYRTDFPEAAPTQAVRRRLTLAEAEADRRNAAAAPT